jgi:hypothetical protein
MAYEIDLRNGYTNWRTFLIEDIVSHSSVLRTTQEAKAAEWVCEPVPARTLCEHSKQILGRHWAPNWVSLFSWGPVTWIGAVRRRILTSLRTLADFHSMMVVHQ